MGKGIDKNPLQGVVSKSAVKGAATPTQAKNPESPVQEDQSEPTNVTPVQQQVQQLSAIDRDEMYRTRERRSFKLQALIPPSLHDELVAKAKERGLSAAEVLIRAMRLGIPQV